MDILYAPWRDAYVQGKKNNNQSENTCVFCSKFNIEHDFKSEFILKKTAHAYVILNLYPYNGGHILVIPAEHQANLEDLSREIQIELM